MGGGAAAGPPATDDVGTARAERLYQKVFNEYGDDSVAQLGGVHLAVEDASNILTKVLERGRLMAYLEQSTRYIPYTDRRGDSWRYLVPAELERHPLRGEYVAAMNRTFETYAKWIDPMREWFDRASSEESARIRTACTARRFAPRRSTRCAACCRRRPSRTSGSTGPGRPTRRSCSACAPIRWPRCERPPDSMLTELRKVIPAFLTRVDQPDRGGRWSAVPRRHARAHGRNRGAIRRRVTRRGTAEVTLTDFDPDGELKVVAAALYPVSSRADAELLDDSPADERRRAAAVLEAARREPDEPAAQAGPRVRAHELSVRHPHRLRRVPRSAAPSAAHDRLAGALDAPRLHAAGRDCRSRRRRRLARGRWIGRRAVRRARGSGACRMSRSTRCRWPTGCGSSWT